LKEVKSIMGDANESTIDAGREATRFSTVTRWIVDIALALHFAAAAGWWWFSPQGFTVGSNPFWTNSVLPVAAMGVAGVGLIALHFGRRAVAAAAVLCFSAAWAAAAVAGRIVFPISLAGVWLLLFVVAFAGGALFVLLVRGERKRHVAWVVSAVSGVAIGWLVVWWQIPESPSTVPWDATATHRRPRIHRVRPDRACDLSTVPTSKRTRLGSTSDGGASRSAARRFWISTWCRRIAFGRC
jgi:hypothetical protein